MHAIPSCTVAAMRAREKKNLTAVNDEHSAMLIDGRSHCSLLMQNSFQKISAQKSKGVLIYELPTSCTEKTDESCVLHAFQRSNIITQMNVIKDRSYDQNNVTKLLS